MELLVCYEDEGVYVNTYGRVTKDVVLQWGEMPTSVGKCPERIKYNCGIRERECGQKENALGLTSDSEAALL